MAGSLESAEPPEEAAPTEPAHEHEDVQAQPKVNRTDRGSLRGKIHIADDFDDMPEGWDEFFGKDE
ncbi:prevent-host-death protein [Streptomyces sp. NPDC002994]|uniref:prevent-host-death protein n=1 Tax=Streptomyces sp. NPDC002994 TaxID=3154441 RepID=UPI0033A27162